MAWVGKISTISFSKLKTQNHQPRKTDLKKILKLIVTGINLTCYIRDASGNVMATYEQIGEGIDRELRLEEQPIYGSDRLGMFKSYKLITYLGMVGEEAGAGYEIVSQDKVVNLS